MLKMDVGVLSARAFIFDRILIKSQLSQAPSVLPFTLYLRSLSPSSHSPTINNTFKLTLVVCILKPVERVVECHVVPLLV